MSLSNILTRNKKMKGCFGVRLCVSEIFYKFVTSVYYVDVEWRSIYQTVQFFIQSIRLMYRRSLYLNILCAMLV